MRKNKLIGKIFGIALVGLMIGAMLGGLPLLVREAEASPGTIYVPDDYAKIQWAVDNATSGDTIIVRNGNYTENVDVNKSVTLLGENLENTTVVGGFKVTADNVVIENFTIAGGYEWDPDGAGKGGAYKAGIYVASCDNVQISNNRIENIQGGTGVSGGVGGGTGGAGGMGAGVYLSSSTNNSLVNNTITGITGGRGGGAWNFQAGGAGGVGAGIYLGSSANNALENNTLSHITGGTGGTAGPGDGSGGGGGVGASIYLSSSTDNSLVNNTISDITGGTGGTGGSWSGSGGVGGKGAGVYLGSSTNNSLENNTISGITGGAGGAVGTYYNTGSRGADGVGYGVYLDSGSYQNAIDTSNTVDGDPVIYNYGADGLVIEDYVLTADSNPTNLGKIALINCSNSIIRNNTLANYTGGTGYTGQRYGSGGTGGVGAGIYLGYSMNNTLESNTISGITGGTGGTGGVDKAGPNGGPGGVGAGIYLSSSSNNSLMNNSISGVTGGTGGRSGLVYNTGAGVGGIGGVGSGVYLYSSSNNSLVNNTISDMTGGTGGSGGYQCHGGPGGVGAGIYLASSTGDNLTSNTIENIRGGTGGVGGLGGSGGTGGLGAGIYLASSTGDNLISNTISNIQAGTGGTGGKYGSGGADGVGYGIYLSSSSNNLIYNNYFNNTNNAWDDGTNTWNTTKQITYTYNGKTYTNYLGNYWSDYTGEDANGDGIGETPYSIDSDADNYPLMEPFENYTIVEYDLAIASTAGGSVTTPDEGTFTYYAGTVVSLVASPASGYRFVNWTGNVSTIANVNAASTNITMNGNYSITANFVRQYDLTISSTTGGSVTTPGEGIFIYEEGTVVGLVASSDVGYYFVNWDGDVGTIADVNAATTTITMQGDYEITARFLAGVVDAKTETVADDTVDATDEADTEVEVDGTATVTVAQYDGNPGGSAPTDFNALDKYIDVYVPDTTEVTELEIRLYYTDDELTAANLSEELLQLLWWDGDEWNECSDSGVNTASIYGYSGYMWAKIRTDTTPSLDDMQGTEFGGYEGPSQVPQGGCFIATAAYGTDTAKEIDILREFRDAVLLPNSLGAKFVSLYYKTSPPLADFISQHEVLRTVVRVGFVDPIVAILNWSHDLWSARCS